MLANDKKVELEGVITTIQRVQFLMGEPDPDGLRDTMVAPLLKLAIERLTKFYEPYKPKRGSK